MVPPIRALRWRAAAFGVFSLGAGHVLFLRSPTVKVAVEPRSADLGQLAHPLDAQTALQRHREFRRRRLLDRDTACWRRASTFCKALLKKSTSTVLSARSRFSLLTSLRSLDSREFCVDTVPSTCASGGSRRYRHLYSRVRL